MAFSLQGFGAGFASQLSTNLNEQRKRQEKLQDEATSIATRLRLQKQAKREEAKLLAEEQAKFLATLGWKENEIANAMKGGASSVKLYETIGTTAFQNGVDPNSLLSISESPEQANSVLGEAGDSTSGTNTLNTYSWNRDAVKALYGEPDSNEVSLDMQLAVNAKKQSKLLFGTQTKDTQAQLTLLQEKEKFLLQKHADLAAAKREANPDTKVTVTQHNTLETLISKNHALTTKNVGLGIDAESKLEIAFEGNEGKGYSALMESVVKMENSIGTHGDDWVNIRLKQERSSVEAGLKAHAYKVQREKPKDVKRYESSEQLVQAIQAGQISRGTPVFVGNDFFVYTGVSQSSPAISEEKDLAKHGIPPYMFLVYGQEDAGENK